jgi:hypothetical protein
MNYSRIEHDGSARDEALQRRNASVREVLRMGPKPSDTEKPGKPGMMGDGTEEQNLDQPGNPAARIKEDEVADAFGNKPPEKSPKT